MKIELLFPELSTVYGDAGNMLYLKKTCTNAEFIETPLQSKLYFIDNDVGIVNISLHFFLKDV